jgi:hypothetical protein
MTHHVSARQERLKPAQFHLKTVFRRLAREKRDPMADLLRGFRTMAKAEAQPV